MNKEQALSEFVKSELNFLLSEKLEKREFKARCRNYFKEKHRDKYGFPKPKEIIKCVFEYLVAAEDDPNTAKKILTSLPLARQTGERELEKILDAKAKSEYAPSVDNSTLTNIKRVGAYIALHEKKVVDKHIEGEAKIAEIEEKIEAKKAEYKALPSVLESQFFEEPEGIDVESQQNTWWRRLYLRSDPFPRKDGLSKIEKELYEDVIIKTEPFQKIINGLSGDPDYLFSKGFLLAGGYGYGKTTFLDYLAYYLESKRILCIRISGKAAPDSFGFNKSFMRSLKRKLMAYLDRNEKNDLRDFQEFDHEDQVCEMVRMTLAHNYDGLIICLDDYHKFREDFHEIFEFLGTLQVLKDTLTREDNNVGFIVSGLHEWSDELKDNSQLMGFLDGETISLPEITTDLICSVFNHRIQAYCYENAPRKINPSFVKRVVSDLKGDQGIRGCITRIVEELQNNEYAVIDSPVEVSAEDLEIAKDLLENNHNLKKSLNKLIFETRFKSLKDEHIGKALELLVVVFTQDGIDERDQVFQSNAFYFQLLKDCSLIQKQKSSDGKLEWAASKNLKAQADTIKQRLGLSLPDYFLKVYAYKDYSQKSPEDVIITNEVNSLRGLLDKLDDYIADSVLAVGDNAMRLYEGLPNTVKKERAPGLFDDAKTAFIDASRFFFLLQDTQRIIRFENAEIDLWEGHPQANEVISAAVHSTKLDLGKKDIHPVHKLKDGVRVVFDLSKDLLSSSKINESIFFRAPEFTEEEIRVFDEVEDCLTIPNSSMIHEAIANLSDLLERKFRSYLYWGGSLLFGDSYAEQIPSSETRSYAYANSERSGWSQDPNIFNEFTRTQYREIFESGNPFKKFLFPDLNKIFNSDDLKAFFDLYCEHSISSSHQKIHSTTRREIDKYRHYYSQAVKLLAYFNRQTRNFLSDNCFVYSTDESKTNKSNNLKVSFAFYDNKVDSGVIHSDFPGSLRRKEFLIHHDFLSRDVFEVFSRRIANRVKTREKGLVETMLDPGAIRDYYGLSQVEFALGLIQMERIEKTISLSPWYGDAIKIVFNE